MLLVGFIEVSRDECEDGSEYSERSELGSSYYICGGNEIFKFEGSVLVYSL